MVNSKQVVSSPLPTDNKNLFSRVSMRPAAADYFVVYQKPWFKTQLQTTRNTYRKLGKVSFLEESRLLYPLINAISVRVLLPTIK